MNSITDGTLLLDFFQGPLPVPHLVHSRAVFYWVVPRRQNLLMIVWYLFPEAGTENEIMMPHRMASVGQNEFNKAMAVIQLKIQHL